MIFKEKGYPFDEKNQENGLGKRDSNYVDVQFPTDNVMSEKAKEQFDANTVDVQKFDAPNNDDDQNIKLPCNDKQLASQPSTKDVTDGYENSNKDVQSCEIVHNLKNEEPNERMKLKKISTLVRSKLNLLLEYAAKTKPTSSSFTITQ